MVQQLLCGQVGLGGRGVAPYLGPHVVEREFPWPQANRVRTVLQRRLNDSFVWGLRWHKARWWRALCLGRLSCQVTSTWMRRGCAWAALGMLSLSTPWFSTAEMFVVSSSLLSVKTRWNRA